jgi:hypothetical protein
MRIVAGCLIVAAASFGLAPSSPELHNRYGLSDWERFTVRPGITATVQYGADHLACQIQIEPYRALIQDVPPQTPALMSSKDVSDVLEELAPTSMRGREISIGGSFQSGCAAVSGDAYENITILTSVSACAPSNLIRDLGVSIIFKREICPKVKNAFAVSEPKSK